MPCSVCVSLLEIIVLLYEIALNRQLHMSMARAFKHGEATLYMSNGLNNMSYVSYKYICIIYVIVIMPENHLHGTCIEERIPTLYVHL